MTLPTPRHIGAASILAALIALTGCTAGTAARGDSAPESGTRSTATTSTSPRPRSSSTPTNSRQTTAPAATGPAAAATAPTKVLVIVEENRTRTTALAGMPYLRSLATGFGQATAYRAVTHPSLPNYLAMVGGSTFGVRDDAGPASHRITGTSVFGQGLARPTPVKTYAEGMPTNCRTASTGRYAVKHNPWTYFVSERSRCAGRDVPLTKLQPDNVAGRLPTIGLVIPDLCHDGHDCQSATADSWLRTWIPRLEAGKDYGAGRLAIVVTFDEGVGSNNNVAFVVVSPYVRHVVTGVSLTHYSLTRALDAFLGAAPLRNAATAPRMPAALHLPR